MSELKADSNFGFMGSWVIQFGTFPGDPLYVYFCSVSLARRDVDFLTAF